MRRLRDCGEVLVKQVEEELEKPLVHNDWLPDILPLVTVNLNADRLTVPFPGLQIFNALGKLGVASYTGAVNDAVSNLRNLAKRIPSIGVDFSKSPLSNRSR